MYHSVKQETPPIPWHSKPTARAVPRPAYMTMEDLFRTFPPNLTQSSQTKLSSKSSKPPRSPTVQVSKAASAHLHFYVSCPQ